MDKSADHIDELIATFLVDEATPDQVSFIKNWIDQSEGNRKYFEQLKLIFEKAGSVKAFPEFDTDTAWKTLRVKLRAGDEAAITPAKTRDLNKFILRIAAGIAMLLLAGFFTYRFFQTESTRTIHLVAEKQTVADTLPDGTDVFLNRKTTLAYTFDKRQNTYTTKLTGEAYFNMSHDDDKVFIVAAEGVLIRDIGTAFNVQAYPDSSTVEVVVEEGEVMFYTEGNPGIQVKANGKGIYDKRTKTFAIADPEPNVTAYKTKIFTFRDQTLAMVTQTLNEVYAEKIKIDDNIRNCRLTVSFNDESIEEITNIIAETLGLRVKKSSDGIRLEGSGCFENIP